MSVLDLSSSKPHWDSKYAWYLQSGEERASEDFADMLMREMPQDSLLQCERMRVVVVDRDDSGVTHVLWDGAALPSERAARGEAQGGQTC